MSECGHHRGCTEIEKEHREECICQRNEKLDWGKFVDEVEKKFEPSQS